MLRERRMQRWPVNALVALLVVIALLWTSATVMAQSSAQYSLGCWAIASGGGDQRSSAQYRLRDAITPVGGEMQGAQYRMRTNHLALYRVLRQPAGPPAPASKEGDIFMPFVARLFHLAGICR